MPPIWLPIPALLIVLAITAIRYAAVRPRGNTAAGEASWRAEPGSVGRWVREQP